MMKYDLRSKSLFGQSKMFPLQVCPYIAFKMLHNRTEAIKKKSEYAQNV